MVASRCGLRAPTRLRAATRRRLTSSAVRYSRGRRAALATRRGGTFPFTVVGLLPSFTREPLLLIGPCPTFPFVCWRDPIWYRDRVGRREPAFPWVQQGRVKTRCPTGHVLATRTVTRAAEPASSEAGSWTRLPPSSAS